VLIPQQFCDNPDNIAYGWRVVQYRAIEVDDKNACSIKECLSKPGAPFIFVSGTEGDCILPDEIKMCEQCYNYAKSE
jgi:hypothetical protein